MTIQTARWCVAACDAEEFDGLGIANGVAEVSPEGRRTNPYPRDVLEQANKSKFCSMFTALENFNADLVEKDKHSE